MNAAYPGHGLATLRHALHELTQHGQPSDWLKSLVHAGHGRIPLPGSGATLQRWQALACVASHDLSLAKLYEGHTDAIAILHELGAEHSNSDGMTWAVWAAEAPQGRVTCTPVDGGGLVLDGTKRWCSGAAHVSHALLTAWYPDGTGPQLVAVAMRQHAIDVQADAWHAVGMAGSSSVDVSFRRAQAWPVGQVGDYVSRPGFWHGGAGVGACWHGGATALAEPLLEKLARSSDSSDVLPRSDAFGECALGKVDLALRSSAALLREAAHWIDAYPKADASSVALRVRLAAEECARLVLDEAGRALGAAPFCRDARFARAAADLPVFVRQSHAERDYAALGRGVASRRDSTEWIP